MKVIFLDFDGVLNSSASFILEDRKRKALGKGHTLGPLNQCLDPVCCSNFQLLLEAVPDAKIVISSTWRELFDLEWLKEKLASYGIDSSRVIDRTPSSFRDRGYEINEWLEEHPEVTKHVILDDNMIGNRFHEGETFVKTKWLVGLTIDHVKRAARVLDENVKLPYIPE